MKFFQTLATTALLMNMTSVDVNAITLRQTFMSAKKDCCLDECKPSCSCGCKGGDDKAEKGAEKVEKVVDDLKKD